MAWLALCALQNTKTTSAIREQWELQNRLSTASAGIRECANGQRLPRHWIVMTHCYRRLQVFYIKVWINSFDQGLQFKTESDSLCFLASSHGHYLRHGNLVLIDSFAIFAFSRYEHWANCFISHWRTWFSASSKFRKNPCEIADKLIRAENLVCCLLAI